MANVKFNSKKSKFTDVLKTVEINEQENDGNMTIQHFYDLFDIFIKDKKLEGLAPRTIYDHKKLFDIFKNYVIKVRECQIEHDFISSDFFKQYLYYMHFDKHYKAGTINIRISSLKCYLNWLFKNKYTNKNYSLLLKKVKRSEDTVHPLSDYNVKKMLNAPNQNTYAGFRDFTIMIIILDCGIRINELCNTLIPDVDLKEKTLTVRGEISKTRKARILPLSKQSVILLRQLIDISVSNTSPYVFMSNSSDKVDGEVVSRNFERYGKKVGVKERCTPYVFRHTFATNAVKSGMDVFTLQRIMGHNQITTTRQYVQLETKDLIKKHDKMNSIGRYLK
ncbi:tyrosine-type recombinase/integrase [Clostridium pasteurianum]|uniref:tyrosine-type recombinase/integrase n=1 Tax=Clostridium pasteurianum TaxID=1501 RepID=UPI002260D13F|nr:site-specific integrase [Clostridium pasteurianum]UZW14326.1 tyrosine-type recombinase/integrase [Clostridium pasteurianum]